MSRTITDVNELICALNRGQLYVKTPKSSGSEFLKREEKILLIKHFNDKDPLSYNEVEKVFMASQEAQDLDEWGKCFGDIKESQRAFGDSPIEF